MNKPSELIQIAGSARGRPGFTLVEMLVAVGAVLLLSIGIGQIFKQVSKLVGTGSAVAELDQYARAIERQLRDDFAALERTPSDETFLAIRGRRAGDVDRNGSIGSIVTGGERTIYLRRDDVDAELRGGITNPYDDGGRGISPRLDEIMFLVSAGTGGSGYASSERGRQGEERVVTAQSARIYYGHGVRPQPPVIDQAGNPYDNQRPLGDTLSGPPNYPIRTVLPDGTALPIPEWGDVFGLENSRNQFAGDFFLLRQAVLLYGGLAAGFPGAGTNRREPLIGESREFAPFIRDMETLERVYTNAALANVPPGGPPFTERLAQPRLLRQGRTDICGQDLDDVRQWLEGMGPAPLTLDPTAEYSDATAFQAGFLDQPDLVRADFTPSQGFFNANTIDRPLWIRQRPGDNGSSPEPAAVVQYNLKSLQSAIAGCFSRVLAESEPTPILREEVRGSNGQLIVDPLESVMDLHATFASRCSNFEVAWSDGTVWRGPRRDGSNQPLRIDLDGNTGNGYEAVYNLGDIIWFDYDYPRRMLEVNPPLGGGVESAPTAPALRPEILSKSSIYHFNAFVPDDSSRVERMNIVPNAEPRAAKYDVRNCGGVASEYFAIWGFREPSTTGAYGPAWVKPRMIRIRMTLHDSQFRIAGGRKYEFIFSIDQN